MTDRIEPLTVDDWRLIPGLAALIRSTFDATDGELALSLANDRESGDVAVDRSARGIALLIAALNAALPDSDPRKITREKLALLRELFPYDESWTDTSPDMEERRAFIDALESYLPPE